ncbi:hypothetical protein ACHQM5_012754 [Ranunculus cassubicifolius]
MEDSGEAHEEDKMHPENSKKRTLKTPAQVEALEKLYNEHTYPTESIKAQLAKDIGLSEKQVSGWFCHRRLKDKNMVLMKEGAHLMGRQDLSSGVIQDRGSALKQDSCSSTRPGEYKYFDPREVESRRLCGQGSPAEDITNRNRSQYVHARNNSNLDNTSSGSTSPSQGIMSPRGSRYEMEPLRHYEMEPSRYSAQNSNYTMMNMKSRGHPAGSEYVNPQDEIEKAAILAVKRQLGRHYREDGPPLGVKFELLPPTAFDAPVEVPVEGPYFLGDSIVPKPVGVLKVHKEPIFDTRHSQSKHGKRSHSPFPEADSSRIKLEHAYPYDDSSYRSMGNSSLTNSRNHVPIQYNTAQNIDVIPARMTGITNKSKKHGVRPMHGVEGKKSKKRGNHFAHPFDEKLISGSLHPKLHNSSGDILQQREYLKGRPPSTLQYDEYLGTEQRDYSRRAKEENHYKEKKKRKENANAVRVNMQLNNEANRTRQSDEYASRTPSPHAPHLREVQIKGYAGEIPTSFSDDETAATSSSMD